jgi:hypothetical protein
MPGAGSQGDPGLDAFLTEEVTELLLDGPPRHAALAPELRQLREAVDALRAAPSRAELRAESLAMAAFRDISRTSLDDTIVDGTAVSGTVLDGPGLRGPGPRGSVLDPVGSSARTAHTLRLEIPPDPAGYRPRRARHRARPQARPAGRAGGLPRPVLRRPRALGSAAAVALLAIIGIFAYAGSLPGPIQNAAHVAFGAPPVKTTSAPAPSVEGTGSPRGSRSPMTGARAIRPSATSSPGSPASASPAGPRQWCTAYFSNPWKPGSKSWDKSDFEKLSKAVPGGSRWVLWYCARYLDVKQDHDGARFSFPGGSWAWTPGHSPDAGPGQPGAVISTEPAARPGVIGPAGGPGPASVPGQTAPAGHSEGHAG